LLGLPRIAVQNTEERETKKELKKIFQSFSRGLAGEKFHSAGAGLGLYIAKEFVKLHQGKIRATSPGEGRGTTFWIELPQQLDEKKVQISSQSFAEWKEK
jgi:signal transduction histidine kinase